MFIRCWYKLKICGQICSVKLLFFFYKISYGFIEKTLSIQYNGCLILISSIAIIKIIQKSVRNKYTICKLHRVIGFDLILGMK